MANLTHAELLTPERVLFSGEAEAVVMRTVGGDITFLANHMDFIAAVDTCVVRIQAAHSGTAAHGSAEAGSPESPASSPPSDAAPGAPPAGAPPAGAPAGPSAGEVRAAVHGGFVKVADNRVTVAAGVAELAGEIDVDRARRALEAATAAEGSTPKAPEQEETPSVQPGRPEDAERAAARARVRLEAAGQSP
jgi:F0F1-type ATP synthase epsilon subunit